VVANKAEVYDWASLALPQIANDSCLALIQLLPPLWRQIISRLDDIPTARVLAVAGIMIALAVVSAVVIERDSALVDERAMS